MPIAMTKSVRDAERLSTEMIELQNENVVLPAVHTRMILKVEGDKSRTFLQFSPFPLRSIVYVALPIPSVVLLLISGATGTAIAVALALPHAVPHELLRRFGRSASRTSLLLHAVECMNHL